jgi:hypothetical protein
MDRGDLEELDRESLVRSAEAAGIRRARILTRPELIDELLRMDSTIDQAQLEKKRGFFGRARDLVARVVERGLHLPDAADRIRSLGTLPPSVPRAEPQAVPTVTLAEIYAAQGHKERAIETLRQVLVREPEHVAARVLLLRLEDVAYVPPPLPLPPEPEVEPAQADGQEDEDAEAAAEAQADAKERQEDGPVDPEVLAIPLGGGSTYVCWRVPRGAVKELALRALIVTPSWDGPSRETRDVIVEATGELVVRGLPERAIVRVAIGTLDGERFVPLAHAPALEITPPRPGVPGGGGLVRWTLRGPVPVVLDDPRAASIARAWSAARRG